MGTNLSAENSEDRRATPPASDEEASDLSEATSPEGENGDDDEAQATSVRDVIGSYLHRVMDIEDCAKEFITAARKGYSSNAERLGTELDDLLDSLSDDKEDDQKKKITLSKDLRRCMREIDRHNSSNTSGVLEKSLFVSLFASLDTFIGNLIATLYSSRPELYLNICREVSLSEVLQYESIADVKDAVLDKEIENIRRKSYSDQFSDLEKRFSIKLKKFEKWPTFIEASQRRNLFTHCDGIVSKQYVDACLAAGYEFKEEPKIGEQLGIGAQYFFRTSRLLTEVAVMLGQTLWRKTNPDDLAAADQNLSELVFDFLHMESWGKAISLSQFALNLPDVSDDQMERIFAVNYAIALKAIDKADAAKMELDKKDWSACLLDFRLAYFVINDDFQDAAETMLKIGEKGELVSEMAYHDWPLFRDFRDRPEFFDAYEAVYGYKYSAKLSSIADEKTAQVNDESGSPSDSGEELDEDLDPN